VLHPFLGFVGREGQGLPNKRKKNLFLLEPKAQAMLCNPSMVSHENMSPQIKHDIGLGL